MNTTSTIGVLGGMGPEATNHMAALITSLTPARQDADHIPVITFNNPQIPSRVEAILHGTASPLPELVRTARLLEAAGANFLVMPCNTAHYYVDDMADRINLPILHMVALTVSEIFAKGYTKVGLLATSATLATGLYHRRLKEHGISVVQPEQRDQQLVMQAIFGPYGVKAGQKDMPAEHLQQVAQKLVASGADVILAGCTEVSVAFHDRNLDFNYIDPMLITAHAAINLARQGYAAPDSTRNKQSTYRHSHKQRLEHLHLIQERAKEA